MAGGTLAQGQSENISGSQFFAGGEDALTALIKQLASGGTPEQLAEAARRLQEINAVRQQRGDYSKQAAFTDAQGAQSQQSRLALEKLIPSITRAAEGAGTSGSSMRALLLQDAANKASESAAALGLKASVDYGNISGGMNQVLEALTRQGNPITDSLLKALEISKGQRSTQTSGGTVAGSSGQSPFGNIAYGGTMAPTVWGDNLLDGTFAATTPTYAPLTSTGAGSNLVGSAPYMTDLAGNAVLSKQGNPVSTDSGYGTFGTRNVWEDYTF
jgi:hypothetical protein